MAAQPASSSSVTFSFFPAVSHSTIVNVDYDYVSLSARPKKRRAPDDGDDTLAALHGPAVKRVRTSRQPPNELDQAGTLASIALRKTSELRNVRAAAKLNEAQAKSLQSAKNVAIAKYRDEWRAAAADNQAKDEELERLSSLLSEATDKFAVASANWDSDSQAKAEEIQRLSCSLENASVKLDADAAAWQHDSQAKLAEIQRLSSLLGDAHGRLNATVLSVNAMAEEKERLLSAINEAESRVGAASAESQAKDAEMERMSRSMDEAKSKLETADKSSQAKDAEIERLSKLLEESEGKRRASDDRIATLMEAGANLLSERMQLQSERDEVHQQAEARVKAAEFERDEHVGTLTYELESTKNQLSTAQAKAAAAEQEHSSAQVDSNDVLQFLRRDLDNAREGLDRTRAASERKERQLRAEIDRCQKERLEEVKECRKAWRDDRRRWRREMEGLRDSIASQASLPPTPMSNSPMTQESEAPATDGAGLSAPMAALTPTPAPWLGGRGAGKSTQGGKMPQHGKHQAILGPKKTGVGAAGVQKQTRATATTPSNAGGRKTEQRQGARRKFQIERAVKHVSFDSDVGREKVDPNAECAAYALADQSYDAGEYGEIELNRVFVDDDGTGKSYLVFVARPGTSEPQKIEISAESLKPWALKSHVLPWTLHDQSESSNDDRTMQYVSKCVMACRPELQYDAAARLLPPAATAAFKARCFGSGSAVITYPPDKERFPDEWELIVQTLQGMRAFKQACVFWAQHQPSNDKHKPWPPNFSFEQHQKMCSEFEDVKAYVATVNRLSQRTDSGVIDKLAEMMTQKTTIAAEEMDEGGSVSERDMRDGRARGAAGMGW